MAERIKIMAEGTSGSGPEGPPQGQQPTLDSSTRPVGVEGQNLPPASGEPSPQRPWHISPGYDPKRAGEYVTGQEGGYTVFTDPTTGKEVARILKISGAAGAEDWLKEAAAQRHSTFQDAGEVVRLAGKFSAAELAQLETAHPGFQASLTDSIRILNETFSPQAPTEKERKELEKERDTVLYFVRDDIRRIYTAATQPVPRADPDSWYGSPQPKSLEDRLEAVDEALANYQERFWDYGEATLRRIFGENADIKVLRQKYEGIASYLAQRVATAIGKELKGLPLESEELGDFYLADIKKELEETKDDRERTRREQRKRVTAEKRLHYNNWREKFDFTWAETPGELDDSVEDWLNYFQQALPREAEEAVYQEVQKGMVNVLASLEQARNHIGLEANDVRIQALREKIVGHVTTIAGARLLESRGGFEYFIKLKTDFAANYNPYYDGIYLKPGFAVMADRLAENAGEIYRGGSLGLEKPLAGDTKTFRSELERQAIRHGIDHALYITEADFERAVTATDADIVRIQNEVASLNLSSAEARIEIQNRIEEIDRRYGWDDEIEQLLLTGGDRNKAMAAHNIQALMRMDIRSLVFQETKESLDKNDDLFGKTPEERKAIIRQRIEAKITEEGNLVLLDEIRRLPDQASRDRALWKWVKDYNKPRIELRREGSSGEPWFPSIWDAERLSISRPEDLIDRALSKDQFKAMVEEVNDPYKGLTDEQIQRRIRNEFRQQVEAEVVAKGLSPEESAKEFNRLIQERGKIIKDRISDVLFGREQREARAIRNYNLNIAQDKFLELQARWGGLTTRVFTDKGMEMRTIFSLAEEILKAKINKEAEDIEKKVGVWKTGYVAANPNLTADAIEAATIQQRRLFRRNAIFAATLGLREIGIANDLPIWNYFYYGDSSQIGAFAPLVGYTHDDKGILPELLDRGRREMEAVFSFLATKYLDEQMLAVVDYPGLVKEDEEGVQQPAHDERPVRPRVINEGGVFKLRDLFEARMMISTSGGVKVKDLISRIADLGIYDELWENGCKDKREWQGFRKRRNRWELRQQSFLNTREWADPITHVKRLAGAADARRFLVGGEVKGQGYHPGALNEPYSGLWKYRDEFLDISKWIVENIRKIMSGSRKLPEDVNLDKLFRGEVTLNDTLILSKPEEVEKFKAQVLKVLEQKDMTKYLGIEAKDRLVAVGGEILKFWFDYMNSRMYLRNRASHAPKNWQWDNELIARAFVAESRRREPSIAKKGDFKEFDKDGKPIFYEEKTEIKKAGGEVLGGDHLAYAAEGRTPTGNDMFMTILRGSTYHVFDKADIITLDGRALRVKADMEAKREVIAAEPLPVEVQTGINKRKDQLRAQGMGVRIDRLINRNVLSAAEINSASLSGDRRSELKKQGIPDEEVNALLNLNRELDRLRNYYIDERLHKEFVGEWPARLVA